MLVVKVEIWPGGEKAARRTLGQLQIWNVSDLAPVSDYKVRELNQDGKAIGQIWDVKQHIRELGFWELVTRALESWPVWKHL